MANLERLKAHVTDLAERLEKVEEAQAANCTSASEGAVTQADLEVIYLQLKALKNSLEELARYIDERPETMYAS